MTELRHTGSTPHSQPRALRHTTVAPVVARASKRENSTGYFGVNISKPGYPKPYQARVRRGGKQVSLGSFATAEEAALCIARSPEGQEAVKRAAAAAPLTSEEARQQAQAEKLTLLVAESKSGYFGVILNKPGQPKPYQVRVWRGGKKVNLYSLKPNEKKPKTFLNLHFTTRFTAQNDRETYLSISTAKLFAQRRLKKIPPL